MSLPPSPSRLVVALLFLASLGFASASVRAPLSPFLDCPISADWVVSFPAAVRVSGLTAVAPCQVVAVAQTDSESSVVSVDVGDGTVLWSVPFVSLPARPTFSPVTRSPTSATRAYLTSLNSTSQCFQVSAVSWDATASRPSSSSRSQPQPQLLWTTEAGCGQPFDLFEVLTFPLRSDAEGAAEGDLLLAVLGASTSSRWFSIDGRTGRMLAANVSVPAGLGDIGHVSGDETQLMLTTPDSDDESFGWAQTFRMNGTGGWQPTSKARWDKRQYRNVVCVTLFEPYHRCERPTVLALQSWQAEDQWMGLDVQSQQQVWKAQGWSIFNGSWAPPAYDQPFSVQVQLHPLNSSWLLLQAWACTSPVGVNQSQQCVTQYAIMDIAEGRLLASSELTSPICKTGPILSARSWLVASGSIYTSFSTPPLNSVWRSFHPRTLAALSSGVMPDAVPPTEAPQFDFLLGLEEHSASLLIQTNGVLHGVRMNGSAKEGGPIPTGAKLSRRAVHA